MVVTLSHFKKCEREEDEIVAKELSLWPSGGLLLKTIPQAIRLRR